jgi:hypothetical protein
VLIKLVNGSLVTCIVAEEIALVGWKDLNGRTNSRLQNSVVKWLLISSTKVCRINPCFSSSYRIWQEGFSFVIVASLRRAAIVVEYPEGSGNSAMRNLLRPDSSHISLCK